MKKLLSFVLALAMIFSLSLTALAADQNATSSHSNTTTEGSTAVNVTDGSATTTVTVSAEQAQFSALVPTNIPLFIGGDGVVTAPNDGNIKIYNTTDTGAAIKLTSIQFKNKDSDTSGWHLADYAESKDSNGPYMKIGSNILGIRLTIGGKSYDSKANGTTYDGANINDHTIAADENLAINVTAIASPVSGAINDIQPAEIVFVVGWAPANP